MDWYVRVYETLPEHPKTYALAEILKIKPPHAVGLLVCLWTWGIRDAVDGDLSKYPDYAIARACRWEKPPQKLVQALIECGWIDQDRRLHDWDQYAGELIDRTEKNKEQARNRQRTHRAKTKAQSQPSNAKNAEESSDENAHVTRDNRDNNAPKPNPKPNLYPNSTTTNGDVGEEVDFVTADAVTMDTVTESIGKKDAVSYCQQNLMSLAPGNYADMRSLMEDGITDELIIYAVNEACAQGKPTWAYVRSMLNRWLTSGVRTIGDAKAAAINFQAKKLQEKPGFPSQALITNPRLKYIDLDSNSEGNDDGQGD